MSYDKELIIHKLERWDRFITNYHLPDWDFIPDLGLYMDQVVVLLVQYIALRGEIRGAFAKIQYGKILLALVLAFGASFWVAFLQLGSFLTLLIAAVAFFAVYGIGLLVTKEPLMEEILGQTLRKLTGRKKGTE